jgi:hypothetical protein
LAKVAVQCSTDTFVVNQSLVLRINICGENRHLRQAPNRYGQYQRTTQVQMTKTTFFFLITLFLSGCVPTEKPNNEFDTNKFTQLLKFSKALFQTKVIDSKSILDSLAKFSDKILVDTTNYKRTPKANLYISTNAKMYFRVYEKPKGTITAIALFINNKQYNVAEYYANGQVICKFSVKENGKRHGGYECFNENGSYRHYGYYQDNKEILDSLTRFDE